MLKRSIAVILLVAMLPQLTACTSWHVQPVSPAQALSGTRPRDVRVRLRHDKSTLVIKQAGIVGDSIVGYSTRDRAASGGQIRRIAVALSDVEEVAVSEPSGGRSLLALGFVVVIGAVIATAVAIGSWHMGGTGGRW